MQSQNFYEIYLNVQKIVLESEILINKVGRCCPKALWFVNSITQIDVEN